MKTTAIVPMIPRLIPGKPVLLSAAKNGEARLESEFMKEALSSPNPVLKSLLPVLKTSKFVSTDVGKIFETARRLAENPPEPSDWRMPNYIQEDSEKTVQFFFIMNAINFKFWKNSSQERFAADYKGIHWTGSEAMVACLTRAHEEGIPILDADFLSKLTLDQARHIFRGNMEMPMLRERVSCLNNVGKVLKEKYGGSFSNLCNSSGGYAFNHGNGMVEQLVKNFAAYQDESPDPVSGKIVKFYKRSQLAVGMLASRLKGTGLFDLKDPGSLTVFADYQLPKTLHHMGILNYAPSLDSRIQSGRLIPKNSREEIELRAHSLYAAKLLEIALRKMGKNVNALNVDYLLWSEGRGLKDIPHHLTVTTAY